MIWKNKVFNNIYCMEEPFEEDIPLGKDQVKAKLSCSLNLKEQS